MYTYGEYYFYEDGKLVSKHKLDPDGSSPRTVYHYDEWGNTVQLDEYHKEDNLGEQIWIDYYDFDEQGNWTRCEVFLSGKHEGEPELAGYRKLTYYE